MRRVLQLVRRGIPWILRCIALTFYHGPKRLMTSRISVKCAAMIVTMCLPALLSSAILTLPAMIFQSPHQNAYFQFASVLEQDPSRWLVVVLSTICALTSLAIPAAMPAPSKPTLY